MDRVLDLHYKLLDVGHADVMVPEWRDIAPRLTDGRGRWASARRRALLAAAVAGAGLIIVPVAADAMEAVAPDAVRDTVIDTITDVLPWDNDAADVDSPVEQPISDAPGSNRRSDRSDRTGTAEADRRHTDPSVDRPPNDRSDATEPTRTDDTTATDGTAATDSASDQHSVDGAITDGDPGGGDSANPAGQQGNQPGPDDANVDADDGTTDHSRDEAADSNP